MSPDTQGLTGGKAPPAACSDRPSGESPTDYDGQPIHRGQWDTTAPVGEECTVIVDGEPLDCRFDLLSASPSGFEWGYGGSGPAQLSIAMLAHAYDDEYDALEMIDDTSKIQTQGKANICVAHHSENGTFLFMHFTEKYL